MKIYDCFMYFDEDLILETRLNILEKYVDYFIIVESKFNHKGEERKLNFNIEKFIKFKDKIKYLVVDELPNNLEEIFESDNKIIKEHKFINNAVKRENSQRNFINHALLNSDEDDFILISDLDEIPCLKNIDLKKINEKIVIFEQIMTYYKFNLALPDYKWCGTKGCLKKNLISPQWLRNVKSKKYPLYRLDILFNNKRYNNIRFIKNGGWHFTNIKTAEEIELKFKSYLHHREFELSGMTLDNIRKIIKDRYAIYDLNVDQRSNKIGSGKKLLKINDKELPEYIINNKKKFSEWFD
jgi:beta-1,4-mannosyl-glycoprotein beta-1,4-N-acetylglucosaminyltransferase